MNPEAARAAQVIIATVAVATIATVALLARPTEATETLAIVGSAFALIGALLGVHWEFSNRVDRDEEDDGWR